MGVDAPNHPHAADAPSAGNGDGPGGQGPPPLDSDAMRRRKWWNRAPLLIVLVLTLIGVAGVFYDSFAPTTEEPLGSVPHAEVQHACDTAYRTLKSLPPLTRTSTRTQLAARTTQETAIFNTMVSKFAQVRPSDRDGRTAVRAWTADWRSVLARRVEYVKALGNTTKHVDLVIPIDEQGAPVTDRMNQYSRTHDLNQCLTQNLQLETVDTIRQYPKTDTVGG
jgi:hypothetical protein